ncbi:hypothetical protein INH39_21000 [Massilia violaceinigra]|uniref:Uncharacterized protein n=1 Tax=Massilia violaceinigra TaxID=2045208 RepID=A0ABY3ZZP6_9BURK|nr:hypothetical protein [Massilia violaceinigra]UOD27949.1 hypothetical protein INH39_21000 [Massilia violaceinigra]
MQRDIEAFVKTSDPGAVLSLLATVTGPLVNVDDPPDDHYLHIYESGAIILMFSAMDDGFLSVWMNAASPWPSSPALARFLAAHLQCIVRCDPESDYPDVPWYSDVFLHIEGGVETLFSWE